MSESSFYSSALIFCHGTPRHATSHAESKPDERDAHVVCVVHGGADLVFALGFRLCLFAFFDALNVMSTMQ